jgi:hypothetical protein
MAPLPVQEPPHACPTQKPALPPQLRSSLDLQPISYKALTSKYVATAAEVFEMLGKALQNTQTVEWAVMAAAQGPELEKVADVCSGLNLSTWVASWKSGSAQLPQSVCA